KKPEGPQPDLTRGVKLLLAALLLLSAGGGIYLFLRPAPPRSPPASSEPAPTAAAALTTGAPATASSGISSMVTESGADATGVGVPRESEPLAAPPDSLPFEEKRPRQTTGSAPKADVPARAPVPKQKVFPPLLSGAAHSGDTQLGPAWDALDNARRPGGRLARENFVDAMGTARDVFSRRPTGEARFLDAFSRAGVAFADGRNAEAWQLLTRALQEAGPAASSRTLRFVEDEVRALGPNPGPDANWVMGLAFADVRGDLEGELAKAEERAPRSPRVREARELSEGR
ncbi:MAG: hypothetical protein ACXWE1_02475, partial [Thermoanaerobaculia bacterium]